MFCHVCNASLTPDAVFCSSCGAQVRAVATGPTQRLAPLDHQDRDDIPDDDIRSGICPKCGSAKIVPKRRLYPDKREIGEVQVIQYERPESLWDFGSQAVSTIRAWICGECGYTELYATNYQELYAVYQKAKEHRRRKREQ